MPSLFSSPTLKVVVEQETIYTHPTLDETAPSDDLILRGTIHLNLPTARKMNSVKAILENVMLFGKEREVSLHKELVIELKDELLAAGDHTYSFSFIIPNSEPEHLRSTLGRTFMFASAIARPSGSLKTDIASPLVQIYVVASPMQAGEPPTSFGMTLTEYVEELGPIRIDISGPYLTVASLICFEISLLSPPSGVTVTSITGLLVQNAEIQSRTSTTSKKAAPLRHILFQADNQSSTPGPSLFSASPKEKAYYSTQNKSLASMNQSQKVEEVTEGTEWRYQMLCRLPHDDRMRPSTMDHSRSRIRIAHQLGVEIRYRADGDVERGLQLLKRAEIASCCSMLDSRALPSYSFNPELKSGEAAFRCDQCVCTHSFDQLFAEENSTLYEEMGQGSPENEFVPPSDPQNKTPAVGGDRTYALQA